ncbi:MAG TPA: hypothetical protein VJH69_01760 [Candidatus Paceibacterota bacterium]
MLLVPPLPLLPPPLVEDTHALPFQYRPEPHEVPEPPELDEVQEAPSKYWLEEQLDAVSHLSALGIPKSELA